MEGEIQILTHENTDYQERMTMLLSKMEEKKNEIEQLEFKIREYASNRKVRFSFYAPYFLAMNVSLSSKERMTNL